MFGKEETMTRKRVVVLGGGIGGVSAAVNLAQKLRGKHEVILIDRRPYHVYQPANLLLMTGERRPGDITRDLTRTERYGVRVILGNILGIDPDTQTVELESERMGYDYLILALGLETHPEEIPGACEGAHHAWELEAAVRCYDALRNFSGGTIVVGMPATPYRCPPAPFEALFSIDTFLHKRGVRQRTEIHFVAPMARPGGDPKSANRWLTEHAEARGVITHFDWPVAEIDPERNIVRNAHGEELHYDLMFMIPPHRPAQVLLDSGLAEPAGVHVDYDTLVTRYPNIYALGDCVNFPASKAGVVAHQQADLIAHNLAVELTGHGTKERFRLHTT